jgi:hypothetical protein
MTMRLRLPELLQEQKPPMTAYGLWKASQGRISLSTAYRLSRNKGVVRYLDSAMLETLCDVFHVEPGALLERQKRRAGK